MDDLLQDKAADGGGDGDGGDPAGAMEADDVQFFESIANRVDKDDILFGSLRWLENFREMKQAIDPLYKDCTKH